MAKVIKKSSDISGIRPAINPEAIENQAISLAYDLALKQLKEGTASSQVISHFLKLATEREKNQCELIKSQVEMTNAKRDQIKAQASADEKYAAAIEAMKRYSGQAYLEDEEDEEDDDGWY